MSHNVTLTDEEYTRLLAASTQQGLTIETLLHEMIARFTSPSSTAAHYSIPTGEADTPEEEAELEALAASINLTHPWPSEMVIEDRGPR